MEATIVKCESLNEFHTDELCHILEIWNQSTDSDLSIARARVEPGVTTKAHHLEGIHERYLIISGSGKVFVESLGNRSVTPGDLVYIPAGSIQYIENTGNVDLVFYAICTPRFVESAYQDRSDG